jgi:hypothetical protein
VKLRFLALVALVLAACGAPLEAGDETVDSRHHRCTTTPVCTGVTHWSSTKCKCVSGCARGLDSCDGVTCDDLQTDYVNCGACSASCTGKQSCVAGLCVDPPAGSHWLAGTTDCGGGLCADLQTDNNNCGACGSQCVSGPKGSPVCVAGACTVMPPPAGTCKPGSADCAGDGVCVDITTGVNCGACGKVCADDQICSSRSCQHDPLYDSCTQSGGAFALTVEGGHHCLCPTGSVFDQTDGICVAPSDACTYSGGYWHPRLHVCDCGGWVFLPGLGGCVDPGVAAAQCPKGGWSVDPTSGVGSCTCPATAIYSVLDGNCWFGESLCDATGGSYLDEGTATDGTYCQCAAGQTFVYADGQGCVLSSP